MDGYLKRILNARVYDVAIESPLEPAPNLSARTGNTVEQDLAHERRQPPGRLDVHHQVDGHVVAQHDDTGGRLIRKNIYHSNQLTSIMGA